MYWVVAGLAVGRWRTFCMVGSRFRYREFGDGSAARGSFRLFGGGGAACAGFASGIDARGLWCWRLFL